ncbi:DUF1467 family protein [Methylocella sp.]|uniref:DUF1467 family protein n=1 Tax=Methylocella sp. TaxID=1978226 RepID=UPI0037852165
MPFSLPLSIAIFVVIWFVVLFAVLPFGITSQRESGDVTKGTDPGAPVTPRLLSKAVWTTAISLGLFVALSIFARYVDMR